MSKEKGKPVFLIIDRDAIVHRSEGILKNSPWANALSTYFDVDKERIITVPAKVDYELPDLKNKKCIAILHISGKENNNAQHWIEKLNALKSVIGVIVVSNAGTCEEEIWAKHIPEKGKFYWGLYKHKNNSDKEIPKPINPLKLDTDSHADAFYDICTKMLKLDAEND